MINIIGILIVISGFFVPHLISPYISSIYFFWLGGLLILQKGILIRGELKWAKWAQIGILINIAANVLMLVAHFLIGYGSITRFEDWISMVLYCLSSPATAIGQKIYPYPETHLPDGSVCFQISYSRTVITTFLNVAIFALLLVMIGTYWQKRKWEKQNSEHANQPDWQ